MKRTRSQYAQRAFTLVEMLLVLVILAVLAAIIIPNMAGKTKKASITAAGVEIRNYEAALNRYEIDNQQYPTSLDALVTAPGNARDWDGPYMNEIKNDPWGNPYVYTLNPRSGTRPFDIVSSGPDSRAGTDDDIALSTLSNQKR